MFGFFKKGLSRYSKTDQLAAQELYAAAVRQARREVFFTNYGVPDSVDGRFDLLVLHLYMIFFSLRPHDHYKDISQCMFDIFFKDLDKSLRESGVGDVSVPKHMKRMMEAFNGRMHAYQGSAEYENENPAVPIAPGHPLFDSLRRNLYGTLDKAPETMIASMVKYMRINMVHLEKQDNKAIGFGSVSFVSPDK